MVGIAPALIETDMVRSNLNARPDLIPVGRFGKVDKVADVVTMLAANGCEAILTGTAFKRLSLRGLLRVGDHPYDWFLQVLRSNY